ncbi:MAG: TetR family transcriptional regulator [Marinobacter sp.]|uniref:TetR family transcriptional regulator n=1 Tax=unclassified Marinobacter TaxID=83889 RepID=UPI00273C420B|nr:MULTISPECIES: TetR family transcriptional regulator [unclassified Marinobacter]MDP4547478.1 TetR family transcriptional regulator [Marinobacter sp. MDS2]
MARKTKAEAAATRESILDAAEQVFIDKGVARGSLEQIAHTAGVTRGAIYWHFLNKQDILDAMLERVRAPLGEMLASAREGGDNLENLKAVCILALRKLAEDERYFRVHYILLHRNESDQALNRHRELSASAISQLVEIMALAENRKRLRPHLTPEQAAYLLHTQMLGLFFHWLTAPDQWPLYDMAPTLVETVFYGLLVDN